MAGVRELFLELAALPSPPGEERAVADLLLAKLRGLGLEPGEDDAGAKIGATAGNIYVHLEGDGPGVPVFLCAHMDTVPPTAALEPVAGEDGIVRNAAGTILGADNKSAVAVMVEALRRVLDERRPHAGIELVLTPKEEVGLRGAAAFDHTRLRARLGYVYDQAAPIGEIVLGAPYSKIVDVTFTGRAAHAGMYPEEGRSAIAAAARAIADFRLGRIDEETSTNVGTIAGGVARNIVPERCTFSAEVRSHTESKVTELVQEMLDAVTFAATLSDCHAETTVEQGFMGYRFDREDEVVGLARTALERTGFTPSYAFSGGGADANVFNAHGLACLNIANGMTDIHTRDERIALADLDAMVEVTLALLDAAREARVAA